MKNINNNDDNIGKSDADIFNKMYGNIPNSNSSTKKPYKPLNTTSSSPQIQKTEADIWNDLYKGVKTKTSSYSGNFKSKTQKFISKFKNKKIIVISGSILVGLVVIFFISQSFLFKGSSYTKNPSLSKLPVNSVVKIVVDEDTDHAGWGSGILFTKDGYILTNAHVITTPLGKDVKNIKVCYTTTDNQEIKCDYEAKIINADRSEDLAVIKVDGGIKEIKPYSLIVQQDDESWTKEIYSLGSEITVIGFPGLGGKSITVTKGIVSGYQNGEIDYDDGSMHKIPYFIKTDTEINGGNSGGAAFDKNNRYIGIPSFTYSDERGKIGGIIYWNNINLYLNHLILSDKITLPGNQYIKRNSPSSESDLWKGIKASFKEDYKNSIFYLEKYLNLHSNDSRALFYLCDSYFNNNEIDKLEDCAKKLRTANPKAAASSWWFSSFYNEIEEKDYEKAYASINIALGFEPDYISLLSRKAELEYYLEKFDDLEKTVSKMFEIDELDSDAYYYGGLLAFQQEDNETAIEFLEYSFEMKPDAVIAVFLADLYDIKFTESQNIDDLSKVLWYRTAGLVLDNSNISNVFYLSDSLMSIFESDEENSWESTLSSLKEILKTLELDESLINPINEISDEDIKSSLIYDGTNEEEITQTEIDARRYFIKMTTAWLYTLIDNKESCSSQFSGFDSDNITKVLVDAGVSKDSSKAIINRNIILECLCTNKDYSNSIMNACITKGINQLH